jgi:hypothetical protein
MVDVQQILHHDVTLRQWCVFSSLAQPYHLLQGVAVLMISQLGKGSGKKVGMLLLSLENLQYVRLCVCVYFVCVCEC